MTVRSLSLPIVVLAAAMVAVPSAQTDPLAGETFDVKVTATPKSGTGAVTLPMTIQIDRYTSETNRKAITDGLNHKGGYPGFLKALRAAPQAGSLEIGGRTFAIRWAHKEPEKTSRVVTVVTDQPVYFVGGGALDGKSKAGYEVAVVKLTMDATGHGNGIMAAAARVKPGGAAGGVRIDDYAEQPLKLTATVRPTK
jgi:hypothetical protein